MGAEEIEKYGDFFHLSTLLRPHFQTILYFFVLTSTLINAVTFTLLRFVRGRLRSTSAAQQLTASERDALKSWMERYRVCEETIRILARQNAQCDKVIFTSLCMHQIHGVSQRHAAISMSITSIKRNIIEILDAARTVIGNIIGHECAACVQTFSAVGQDKKEGVVSTIARDSVSSTHRPNTVVGHKVKDNDTHIRIFIEGEELVVVEDIKKEMSERGFRTTSRGWRSLYNSVMVAAIPPIDPYNVSTDTVATLCIDSKNGGLQSPICHHFVKELTWRLSVLLYQLDALQRDLEKLSVNGLVE